MGKFADWFDENRASIGYTIGAANLFNGIINLINGNLISGIAFTVFGVALLFDTYEYK